MFHWSAATRRPRRYWDVPKCRAIFKLRLRIHVRKNGCIRNIFDQARSEHRRRDAEDHIVEFRGLIEIRLAHAAARRVRAACDREEFMHVAVLSIAQRAIGTHHEREPHGEHGPIGCDEWWYNIRRTKFGAQQPPQDSAQSKEIDLRWGLSLPALGCEWQLLQLFVLNAGQGQARARSARCRSPNKLG